MKLLSFVRTSIVAGNSPQPWKPTLLLSYTVTLIVCFLPVSAMAQEQQSDQPDKAVAIRVLRQLLDKLNSQDFESASEQLVLPPNFKPEMLAGIIKNKELSKSGIDILERDAKFGSAEELFGIRRATYFAEKANVDVNQCFGFNHETKVATAEVIGVWSKSKFKLIRIDDIGKLEVTNDSKDLPATTEETSSIEDLVAAVLQQPSDPARRGRLAMAYFQQNNYGKAWRELMAGYENAPEHGGINKGIAVLINTFEKLGAFQTTTNQTQILRLLGSPQKTVELTGRTRMVYAFFGVDIKSDQVHEVVDLRGAEESLYQPTETVSIDLDGRGWECRMRKKQRGSSVAFYLLANESWRDWNERFAVERFVGGSKVGSAEMIAEKAKKQLADRHPGIEIQVLASDKGSVTLESRFQSGDRNVFQISRYFVAPTDVHLIRYTLRTNQDTFPQAAFENWRKIFDSATLLQVQPETPKQ